MKKNYAKCHEHQQDIIHDLSIYQHVAIFFPINQQIHTTFVFGDNYFIDQIDCLFQQNHQTGRNELMLYEDGRINIDNNILDHSEYCISDVKLIQQLVNGNTKKYSAMIRYCTYPAWYLIWAGYVEPTVYLVPSLCLLFLIVYNISKRCKNL